MRQIKIGSRDSLLALVQTNWVKNQLESIFPDCVFKIVPVKTKGDMEWNVPLEKIGGEGAFVKKIEELLLSEEVDLAVHSLKDVPTVLPDGLMIGAIPQRLDPRDILISKNHIDFDHLLAGAIVGTDSLRRRAQLLQTRKDIHFESIRGNIDTRINKLKEQNLDAIILAYAGMKRLDRLDEITQILPVTLCIPAVGQGALCVEIRTDDRELREKTQAIHHSESAITTNAERAFLRKLGGGCKVPIAALGQIISGQLTLTGMVADSRGSKMIRSRVAGTIEDAEPLGEALAEILLSKGAGELLHED